MILIENIFAYLELILQIPKPPQVAQPQDIPHCLCRIDADKLIVVQPLRRFVINRWEYS